MSCSVRGGTRNEQSDDQVGADSPVDPGFMTFRGLFARKPQNPYGDEFVEGYWWLIFNPQSPFDYKLKRTLRHLTWAYEGCEAIYELTRSAPVTKCIV
jgi:hypothetical protein